jgi:hypothetical protein
MKRMITRHKHLASLSELSIRFLVLLKASSIESPWDHGCLPRAADSAILYYRSETRGIFSPCPNKTCSHGQVHDELGEGQAISLQQCKNIMSHSQGVTATTSPRCQNPTPVSSVRVKISLRRGRQVPHSYEPLYLETKRV